MKKRLLPIKASVRAMLVLLIALYAFSLRSQAQCNPGTQQSVLNQFCSAIYDPCQAATITFNDGPVHTICSGVTYTLQSPGNFSVNYGTDLEPMQPLPHTPALSTTFHTWEWYNVSNTQNILQFGLPTPATSSDANSLNASINGPPTLSSCETYHLIVYSQTKNNLISNPHFDSNPFPKPGDPDNNNSPWNPCGYECMGSQYYNCNCASGGYPGHIKDQNFSSGMNWFNNYNITPNDFQQHSTSGNAMLLVHGGDPTKYFWGQNVSLCAGAKYKMSYYFRMIGPCMSPLDLPIPAVSIMDDQNPTTTPIVVNAQTMPLALPQNFNGSVEITPIPSTYSLNPTDFNTSYVDPNWYKVEFTFDVPTPLWPNNFNYNFIYMSDFCNLNSPTLLFYGNTFAIDDVDLRRVDIESGQNITFCPPYNSVPGVISGDQTVCSGVTKTYTTNGDPGGTWSWSNPLNPNITSSTQTPTPPIPPLLSPFTTSEDFLWTVTSQTQVDVTYTAHSNGCNTPASTTYTVTVLAPPTITITYFGPTQPICPGTPYYFEIQGPPNGTITFSDGLNFMSGTLDANGILDVNRTADGPNAIASSPLNTIYVYTVTDALGCSAIVNQSLTIDAVRAYIINTNHVYCYNPAVPFDIEIQGPVGGGGVNLTSVPATFPWYYVNLDPITGKGHLYVTPSVNTSYQITDVYSTATLCNNSNVGPLFDVIVNPHEIHFTSSPGQCIPIFLAAQAGSSNISPFTTYTFSGFTWPGIGPIQPWSQILNVPSSNLLSPPMYLATPTDAFTSAPNNAIAGLYTVDATDASGCIAHDEMYISYYGVSGPNITASIAACDDGGNNGPLLGLVTVSGPSGSYFIVCTNHPVGYWCPPHYLPSGPASYSSLSFYMPITTAVGTYFELTTFTPPGWNTPNMLCPPPSLPARIYPQAQYITDLSACTNQVFNNVSDPHRIELTGGPGIVGFNCYDANNNILNTFPIELPCGTSLYDNNQLNNVQGFLLPIGTKSILEVYVKFDWCIVRADCGGVFETPAFRKAPPENNTGNSETADISVYPNPNNGTFNIKGNVTIIQDANEAQMEILDLLGKVVYKEEVALDKGNIDKKLSLSNDLPNGVYIIKINGGDANKVIRFVLNR